MMEPRKRSSREGILVNSDDSGVKKLKRGVDEMIGGDHQDDGESLAVIAAMMLSRRFDSSCIGHSGSQMLPSPELGPESSRCSDNAKELDGENCRVGGLRRNLRPKKHNASVRKRRRFHEVSYEDVDPCFVLKKRIQVFCSLDSAWSEGVVKDYDPSRRLHYVRYSNHDGVWISLEQARFKLLVFPSEIISKAGRETPGLVAEQKKKEGDMEGIDGNSHCHFTESPHAVSWLSQQMQGAELTETDFLDDFDPSILLELKEPRCVSLSHRTISDESPNSFPMPVRSADDVIINMVVDNCSVEPRDCNAPLVYFRKRFHKRTHGLNDTQLIDFDPGGSSCSVKLLSSLSDGKGALEVFSMAENPMKCIRVTLKLRLLPQTHVLASEILSFCHGCFFHEFGKLMAVWPMIQMEIFVIDNSRGLKLLLFEGCLSLAVNFACLIIKTFFEDNQGSKLTKYEMPFTSIHLKLSGLYDRRHLVGFLLSRFMRLEVSKWRFLERSLKQHCVTTRLLPVTECTYANINTLPSRSIPNLNASVIDSLVSFKGFTGHSFLDTERHHKSISSVYMYMNTDLPYFCPKNGRLPLCAFSSTAASPILLSLHLKLLIEKNAASVCLKKTFPLTSEDCPGYPGKLSNGFSLVENASEQVSKVSLDTLESSLDKPATGSVGLSCTPSKVRADALSESIDSDWLRTSDVLQASDVIQGNMEKKGGAVAATFQRFPNRTDSWLFLEKPLCSFPEASSSNRSDGGYNDSQTIRAGHAGHFARGMDQLFDVEGLAAESSSHLAGKMELLSVNSNSSRSTCHQNLQSSVTTKSDCQQNLRQTDLAQIVYAGGYRPCSKPRSCRRNARPYTHLRLSGANRLFDAEGCRKGLQEPLICYANVLITTSDKGWRECGAQVGLESDDQMFCRISVTLSGVTKYTHKAYDPLQAGTTKHHSRAATWKGGNDWTLEFTDRTQWSRFKVLYEECCNRNIQVSSARNIPIPGVRLIADKNVFYNKFPFVRTSSKYIQQEGTEVDMAMDPSRILYDMDSSDEEWVLKGRDSSSITGSALPEVTYDMFERVIDMLEKLAYSQKCEFLTNDEIEKRMANLGPLCVLKPIHDYWQHKRQKKGLPLIRQFQPPLWENFQQQLKEWEVATDEMHSTNGREQTSGCSVNKPPMFAFCLRPRGLEVPKKWSKKRSHRKFISTGSQSVFSREWGKKFRRLSVGDEKASMSYRYPDSSSRSKMDAAMTGILTMSSDGSRNNHQSKLYKNNPKKTGPLLFSHNSKNIPLSEEKKSREIAATCRTTDMYGCSVTKQSASGKKYLTDVVRLSEASSISQRASNMAKLKRAKAHQLLHKADLALHKATVALMIAESMQASENALSGKG